MTVIIRCVSPNVKRKIGEFLALYTISPIFFSFCVTSYPYHVCDINVCSYSS